MVRENKFQLRLRKDLEELFPGCIVLLNDPNYIQGFPDWTILYKDKWAVLECKRNNNANKQPNQTYYVNKLNGMSYSRFVYPENKDEILDDLKKLFE